MYSIFQQLRPLCTLSYLFFLLRPRDEQAVTLPFDKRKEEKLMIFFYTSPRSSRTKSLLDPEISSALTSFLNSFEFGLKDLL